METSSDILFGLGATAAAPGTTSAKPQSAANALFNQLFLSVRQALPSTEADARVLTGQPTAPTTQGLAAGESGKGLPAALPLQRQALVLSPGEQALTGAFNTPAAELPDFEELSGEALMAGQPWRAHSQIAAQPQALSEGGMPDDSLPAAPAAELPASTNSKPPANAGEALARTVELVRSEQPVTIANTEAAPLRTMRESKTVPAEAALAKSDAAETPTDNSRADKIVDIRKDSLELDLARRNQLLAADNRSESQKPTVELLTGSRSVEPGPTSGNSFQQTIAQLQSAQPQPLQQQVNAAPRELHTAIPLNAQSDPGFAEAFGEKISWLVGKGNQSATIQLAPEELGQVQVRVTVGQNGATQVEIHTHKSSTGDLMESMMPRLQAAMESQGIKLDEVRFSQSPLSTDNGGLAQRGDAGPGREQAGQARGTAGNGANADGRPEEDLSHAFETPLNTPSGVDYYA